MRATLLCYVYKMLLADVFSITDFPYLIQGLCVEAAILVQVFPMWIGWLWPLCNCSHLGWGERSAGAFLAVGEAAVVAQGSPGSECRDVLAAAGTEAHPTKPCLLI